MNVILNKLTAKAMAKHRKEGLSIKWLKSKCTRLSYCSNIYTILIVNIFLLTVFLTIVGSFLQGSQPLGQSHRTMRFGIAM